MDVVEQKLKAAIEGQHGGTAHLAYIDAVTETHLRVIARAQCTVGRTSLRYRVQPSDVLVITRGRAGDRKGGDVPRW